MRRWAIILGLALFAISATLCVKAIRWDRWARYESTHPRWHERGAFGIERYSDFKAWQFWRACWTRGLAASIISTATIVGAIAVGASTWNRSGFSGWLLLVVFLHSAVLVYFAIRWGPDFGHPAPSWGG
jgi:hypothetical protein